MRWASLMFWPRSGEIGSDSWLHFGRCLAALGLVLFDDRQQLACNLLGLAAIGLKLTEERQRDLARGRGLRVERVAILALFKLEIFLQRDSERLTILFCLGHRFRAFRLGLGENRAVAMNCFRASPLETLLLGELRAPRLHFGDVIEDGEQTRHSGLVEDLSAVAVFTAESFALTQSVEGEAAAD